MIPVTKKDFELKKNSDGIKELQTEDVVLEHDVESSDYEKFSNLRVPDKARASLMELDSGAENSEFDSNMLGNGRSMEFKISPSEERRFLGNSDTEGEDVDMEMKFSGSFVDAENSTADRFDGEIGQSDAQYKSLLNEFDDYVANEKSGALVAAANSRAMSYGFEVGDMVWGKVKSHPWWPGHIFNDALVSPSVRRIRREGYVLVAFFGDSSYGWFDPAELVPFDPNYYEKSRQTTSRTFLKAVEEAVDEGSRRRGLGLICKCRNRYNFRRTNVEGYFAVDVPDFEIGGIYSWNQIRRSRESFKPSETLSFVKQLALTPRGGDHRSINFSNNKATIFAYRRAVYEEFDETYAQAFGVLPGRTPRETVAAFEHFREPVRAPLSGPLVIAEALGGEKSVIKPMKLKDQSKKDRYLFKRREESSNLKDIEIKQEQTSSTVPSSLVGGSTETEVAGDYVLLKRTPAVPVKPHTLAKGEQGGFADSVSETASLNIPSIEAKIGQVPVGTDLVSQGHSLGVQASSVKEMVSPGKMKETMASSEVVSLRENACPDMEREMAFPSMLNRESLYDNIDAVGEVRFAETENKLKSPESIQQPELNNLTSLEGDCTLDQVSGRHVVPEPTPAGVKYFDADGSVGGVMKPKVLKRQAEELSSSTSFSGERKKKKKKRDIGEETNSDHLQKQLSPKKVRSIAGKLAGKSKQVGLGSKEDFRVEYQKKVNASSNSSSHSGMSPVFGRGNCEFDVPQLLSDLQAFALDPFHGIETDCHAIVQKFFLRFRSRVYQKSLVLSPPSEAESAELRAAKSPDVSLGTDNLSEHVRDLSSSNTVKPLLRRDDPTKAGRKRVPSDRLEEMAAKKLKKISDLKLLALEKKSTQKLSDTQRRESRESALPTAVKVKRDPGKKLEPSVKKVDPTILVLKFPPETSLPSLNELKARFGRFGPIDQSGLRVFWKSLTCRVVFLYKPDAQAAYQYAVGNKSLFGNVNVKYYIREVGAPVTEASELEKGGGDDNPSEAPRLKDPTVLQGRASTPTHLPQLPAVQLKSCLKKSSGDDSGIPSGSNGGGSSKGTTRVKFMLGGEESSKGEQLMIGNRINNMNANFADGGTSSVAMDINSNYFQKVIPPFPLPILPLPAQFIKPPHISTISTNMHISDISPRNTLNHSGISATPPSNNNPNPNANSTDISQQMLSLLTRCSDVVTNVTGLLGYVPYHPL